MIKLKINGQEQSWDGDPDLPLLWFLRDEVGLTGTKFGCGQALCGACTVRVAPGRGVRPDDHVAAEPHIHAHRVRRASDRGCHRRGVRRLGLNDQQELPPTQLHFHDRCNRHRHGVPARTSRQHRQRRRHHNQLAAVKIAWTTGRRCRAARRNQASRSRSPGRSRARAPAA